MPGLLRGIARVAVVAGTATAVSNRVSRRQAGRWAAKDQQEAAEAEPQDEEPEYGQPDDAPPEEGEPSMDQKIGQLRQLGELRDQGILSEAEFQAQKQTILG
jgi:hypothetical protein